MLLNSIAREIIDRQRGKNPERAFTYKSRPVTRMLNSAWRKARKRAELPDVRVHDLRHTFSHRLRAAGVSEEDRKALLGHTTGTLTTHYSQPDLARLLRHVERICKPEGATVLRISRAKLGQKVGQNAPLGNGRVSA